MKLDRTIFLRRYGVAIVAAVTLVLYTVSVYLIVSTIVRHNTTVIVTEQVTAELRASFQQYLDEQEAEANRARFLSGEASRQAAISTDAVLLAKLGQGVMNTYQGADLDDAKKVMLCAVCRAYSGGEFAKIKCIADAVNQPDQWWGYDESMSYTEDLYNVGLEVAGIYHNGSAMPCASDLVYAGWNGTEIVLRNQWEANASARYY